MTEQWQELKETITEMRDNDGTGTQQETCKFLANYMEVLEKQMQQPSEDCISRQKALDCFEQTNTRQGAKYAIKTLPSVTPQRPKGKWIKIQSGNEDFPESIVCSRCKNENSHLDFDEHSEPIGKVFVTSKYCPNCGAEMNGGGEDADCD